MQFAESNHTRSKIETCRSAYTKVQYILKSTIYGSSQAVLARKSPGDDIKNHDSNFVERESSEFALCIMNLYLATSLSFR